MSQGWEVSVPLHVPGHGMATVVLHVRSESQTHAVELALERVKLLDLGGPLYHATGGQVRMVQWDGATVPMARRA